MNYGTEDEGEETAEYLEEGQSSKTKSAGTMSSLMKSFMGK